jgi:hypothetical protein
MNKMLVGYTRHNHKDAACNRGRVAAEERLSSSDEVEARILVDWSSQEDLFGENQTQDLLQVRCAMNAQEEVSEPIMDDSNTCASAGPRRRAGAGGGDGTRKEVSRRDVDKGAR